MTEYRYHGNDKRSYPDRIHPEHQNGVLWVDPDEIIEFGDQIPPEDGLWSSLDPETNEWVQWTRPGPAPSIDEGSVDEPPSDTINAAEDGPGTGAASGGEPQEE